MTLHKGQRIFFKGLDGQKRAFEFAQEFDGSCKVEGCTVTLTKGVVIGQRSFTRIEIFGANTPAALKPALSTGDFRS